MGGKAYDIHMSDTRVCGSFIGNIKCWDWYTRVVQVNGLHIDKGLKQLSVSDNLICSISKQNEMLCVTSDIGAFKLVTPEGLGTVKKVAAGVTSTAVIDTKGNLKFWYNYPMYDPE